VTLRDFTNAVSQAMCAKVGQVVRSPVAAATRGALQASREGELSRADAGELAHALFNGRSLGLGGHGGAGVCRLCSNKNASGVCKTCSTGLGTERAKPFWVCYPGSHGRQCYCQHLHEAGRP
jgi:hypothetical protein